MMQVKVRFYASLRALVGFEELDFGVPKDSTIKDLLEKLTEKFGSRFEEVRTKDPFEGYVVGDGSNPAILVNGRVIDLDKDLEVRLNEGDQVVIMPLMAGG